MVDPGNSERGSHGSWLNKLGEHKLISFAPPRKFKIFVHRDLLPVFWGSCNKRAVALINSWVALCVTQLKK